MFCRDDFTALKSLLSGLKGSFIMTLNDLPEVRALFSEFDVEGVGLHYTVCAGTTEAREVIISCLR